jgi:glycerol-3-phosphate acyltransferase
LVQEGYIALANTTEMEPPLRKEKLAKTIVFYDGRLVQRPTPFLALVIHPLDACWLYPRRLTHSCRCTSDELGIFLVASLGVRVVIKGKPPRITSETLVGKATERNLHK